MFSRIIAIILLILMSPILCIISFLIIIFSGYPIIYKHKRSGYKYIEFEMLKFRTMHLNHGPSITFYNDRRVTKIGNILRKLKIDEIPQLLNIINGEMNIIGPRPESVQIVKNHPEYFRYLNDIKPGITDINSIIFKNESNLLRNVNMKTYEEEILPIKNRLILITSYNQGFLKKILLFILSIVAIFHHKLSLQIINKFFLPYHEKEFRLKLNNLLSEKIF